MQLTLLLVLLEDFGVFMLYTVWWSSAGQISPEG